MKRRVQRAHANKRALRVISASEKLSFDNYNLLLDASFLRAAVMSYMQDEGRLLREYRAQHNNNNSDRGSSNIHAPPPHAMDAESRILHQMGRALASNNNKNNNSNSNNGDLLNMGGGGRGGVSRSRKGTQLHFYYLPETGEALQRLIRQQQQAENNKKKFKTSKIEEAVRYLLSKMHRVYFAQDGEFVAEGRAGPRASPNDHRHKRRDEGKKQPVPCVRNEGKTIAAFLQELRSRGQRTAADDATAAAAAATAKEPIDHPKNTFLMFKNAHHFFIATQNHDVRRLLPPSAALLRLGTNPLCVFVEVRGEAYQYPSDGKQSHNSNRSGAGGAVSSAPKRPRGGSSGGSGGVGGGVGRPGRSVSGGRTLSAADVAFMEHLGVTVDNNNNKNKNKSAAGGGDLAQAAHGENKGSGSGSPADAPAASAPGRKRARRPGHNPNPLSVKKKQKREVFRID